jgi:hypothetical protein
MHSANSTTPHAMMGNAKTLDQVADEEASAILCQSHATQAPARRLKTANHCCMVAAVATINRFITPWRAPLQLVYGDEGGLAHDLSLNGRPHRVQF